MCQDAVVIAWYKKDKKIDYFDNGLLLDGLFAVMKSVTMELCSKHGIPLLIHYSSFNDR